MGKKRFEQKKWCSTRPVECDGSCCYTKKKKRGKGPS